MSASASTSISNTTTTFSKPPPAQNMGIKKKKSVAIIGGGVSGIAAAITLTKAGHSVTIFEKSTQLGGIWSVAYDQVSLQNTANQYHFTNFPWPNSINNDDDKTKSPVSLHPSGQEIRTYLHAAVKHFQLDLRLGHSVQSLTETENGWFMTVKKEQQQQKGDDDKNDDVTRVETVPTLFFDFVICAVGQYMEGKNRPKFPGEDIYQGKIITERDYHGSSSVNQDEGKGNTFANKRVAVVGFGKSALDMAAFAGKSSATIQTYHIFRSPHWTIPYYIFGIHFRYILFTRFGSTALMTCWMHPTGLERFVHNVLSIVVEAFWVLVSAILAITAQWAARGQGPEAQARVQMAIPDFKLITDLRSATAMRPKEYFPLLASGKILPRCDEIETFTPTGIKLKSSGEEIKNIDVVVLSIGSKTPTFPFMPKHYRSLLERNDDGVQLYRHLIHPDIPNFAFAGYNHCFLHIAAVEIGMIWLHAAMLTNDLILPTPKKMHQDISEIQDWKRKNIPFETSRGCGVNTRFQQYLDLMLKELGVNPYRKKNPLAELFDPYELNDYHGVYEEYCQGRSRCNGSPLYTIPLAT